MLDDKVFWPLFYLELMNWNYNPLSSSSNTTDLINTSLQAERSQVISQLKPLTAEDKQFRMVIDGKRKEMEPLHAALGKLRNANNAERGMGICSSEEELDGLVSYIF